MTTLTLTVTVSGSCTYPMDFCYYTPYVEPLVYYDLGNEMRWDMRPRLRLPRRHRRCKPAQRRVCRERRFVQEPWRSGGMLSAGDDTWRMMSEWPFGSIL